MKVQRSDACPGRRSMMLSYKQSLWVVLMFAPLKPVVFKLWDYRKVSRRKTYIGKGI